MIPYGRQDISDEDIAAVVAVLKSDWLTQGPAIERFERKVADYCGARFAIAVSNATAALHLACLVLGVRAGDKVWTSPNTFVASANCARYCGADVAFIDIDPDTYNLSVAALEARLEAASKNGCVPKVVIPVHFSGQSCDMKAIHALAGRYGFSVLEDASHAIGGRYDGKPIGNCEYADAAVFSFHPVKIVTSGEGGMVTTNDETLWRSMWSYKDHGKSYAAVYEREHAPGFRWLHESFGTNWRMLEMQAVIGRIQLKRMADWSAKRRAYGEQIWATCRQFAALSVPDVPADSQHAHYKCYVYVRPELLAEGWSRDRIVAQINALGVPCFQGTCSEVYLEKAFDGSGLRPAQRLPVAQALGETSMMFLVHPTLTPAEVEKTCAVIATVMGQACLNA